MKVVTNIFSHFENDLDFLSKVSPPSWLRGSLRFFITNKGMDFLDKKYLEFKYKVREPEKCVDTGEKSGDDLISRRIPTLRDFLNER
jgi:hypothetical protein